jgi:hypothetical protein
MEYGIEAARDAGLIVEYRTLGHPWIGDDVTVHHTAQPEMSKNDAVTEPMLNLPVHMIDGKLAYCATCGQIQRETPSGITCVNGHGGADQA